MIGLGRVVHSRTQGLSGFWRPRHSFVGSVQAVRDLGEVLRSYSGNELIRAVDELRETVSDAGDATWLPRVGAIVVEAFRRVRGIDLYDTQIRAGLILCDRPPNGRGYVVEMQTGEGKTFAAAFPAVAFALHGRGVHVATSNKYLADRDAELLRPIYECLDLTVAALPEASQGECHDEKVAAYAADITYGPGYEFGFDYLRDQLQLRTQRTSRKFAERYRQTDSLRRAQRPLFAAVIDEVDHVLLDDANSPLVLAASTGTVAPDEAVHLAAHDWVEQITDSADFDQIAKRTPTRITLTEAGQELAWQACDDCLTSLLKRPWLDYVGQALHARHVLHRDVHYVVDDDAVQIVDASTGRIFADRTWSEGLHQAVEAKESLPIRDGNRTLARVTRQRFSRMYQHLCGMTGTATGSEQEFATIYRLSVEAVEPRRPCQREVGAVQAFPDAESRWAAVVEEVRGLFHSGRPVLVGTTSVSASERIAELLDEAGLPFQMLNGRQDESEADIIRQAGARQAITVATGIAGRGTDIAIDDDINELGGLHVVVAEMQASRRVERQLVGRAARQGDRGSASRYVAADDPYLVDAAPALATQIGRGRRVGIDKALRTAQQEADKRAERYRIALWKQDGQRDDLVARLASR